MGLEGLGYDFSTIQKVILLLLKQKKQFRLGVFNDKIQVFRTPKVDYAELSKRVKNGYYDSEFSGLELQLNYTQVGQTQTGQPQNVRFERKFILYCEDKVSFDFPLTMEAKLFGVKGKPDTVAVDTESGDVYLVYMNVNPEIFEMLHFGVLSKLSKDIVIDDDFLEAKYEFGVDKQYLYNFITGDEGWNYLRDNMYIQFNGVTPTVKLKVGIDDSEEI